MKRVIFALLFTLIAASSAVAWDSRGHSTVAYLAERHLTPRAKANIERYINGKSIVYYASWMDYNRTDPPFDVTNDWHVDYWTDKQRTDSEGNPQPPLSVSQIKRIVAEMGDFRTMPDSLVNINIKYLVHLVGDMHCPVHIDFPRFRPVRVTVDGKTTKYHAMWDGMIVSKKHKELSAMQFARELDKFSAEQIATTQQGTPDDWYAETVREADKAFKLLPEDKIVTYDNYFNKAIEIVEERLTVAGYRLAVILNSIFDK